MKKYLVTGAGGFIGAATAQALLEKEAEVCTIDDFSTGLIDNVPLGVELISGRCDSPEVVNKLSEKRFDAVVHLAGQSSGEISFEDPIEDLRKNVVSTLRLLEYSRDTGVKHFIYGSSVSTYGCVTNEPVTEETATAPLSCYGVGKLSSEHYLRVFGEKGLGCTSLRLANVFGPGQNLQNMQQGMVSIYLAQILGESDSVIVKGSLDRARDFVYISDVVDAILLSLCNPVAFGKTYNLGSGVSTSVRELLETAQKCSNTKKRIVIEKQTPGDQHQVRPSIEKIRKDLGYMPKVSLRDGLQETIAWVNNRGELNQSTARPCCRLCNADQSMQLVRSSVIDGGRVGQKFWRCQICTVIYLYPPHSEADERKFYSHEFESFMGKRSGHIDQWEDGDRHRELNEREKNRRLTFLQKYLRGVENCLEVGCSSGFMLAELDKMGLFVAGIEPSKKFSDYLGQSNINTFSSLEECRKDRGKFDLIIHYFVLEHIREPKEFLKTCLEMLNPGGLMIFDVPCAADPLIEPYAVAEFEEFYWSIAHHWYFNQTSLEYLLSRVTTDFEIIPDQRYDLSNHMIWMRDGKPGGLGKFQDLLGTSLNDMYKVRLTESGKCDTLTGIVRRPLDEP